MTHDFVPDTLLVLLSWGFDLPWQNGGKHYYFKLTVHSLLTSTFNEFLIVYWKYQGILHQIILREFILKEGRCYTKLKVYIYNFSCSFAIKNFLRGPHNFTAY